MADDGAELDRERGGSVEGRLVVLEARAALSWLLAAVPLFGALAAVLANSAVLSVSGLSPFFMLSAIWWPTLWWLIRRTHFLARRRERNVRITSEGVFADGALVLPRARVADGYVQPKAAGATVRLVDKRGGILFEVEASIRAAEVLRVLRLDAASRRAVFFGAPPLYATEKRRWISTAALFGAFLLFGFIDVRAFPFVFFPLLLVSLVPSRIVIGADGILLRWLGWRRFIPMRRIKEAWPEGDRAIAVALDSGVTERIHTSGAKRLGGWGVQNLLDVAGHRDSVFERLREALDLRGAGHRAIDVAALVGRGTRTGREWLDALAKLRATSSGYRDVVVRDEDLWRVVEDPSAEEDARAGAAMVLRASLDGEGRSRLRVAAEATASPKLRVALDAAAAATDEEAAATFYDLADASAAQRDRARAR